MMVANMTPTDSGDQGRAAVTSIVSKNCVPWKCFRNDIILCFGVAAINPPTHKDFAEGNIATCEQQHESSSMKSK